MNIPTPPDPHLAVLNCFLLFKPYHVYSFKQVPDHTLILFQLQIQYQGLIF